MLLQNRFISNERFSRSPSLCFYMGNVCLCNDRLILGDALVWKQYYTHMH